MDIIYNVAVTVQFYHGLRYFDGRAAIAAIRDQRFAGPVDKIEHDFRRRKGYQARRRDQLKMILQCTRPRFFGGSQASPAK
jgi:hypothetical protein